MRPINNPKKGSLTNKFALPTNVLNSQQQCYSLKKPAGVISRQAFLRSTQV
jgi:hypothetical protein